MSWIDARPAHSFESTESGGKVGMRKSRTSIPEILRDHAAHTSLHGVWQASNSGYSLPRRLIWFLAVCGGTVLFMFIFIRQIMYYLEYRVQTTITIDDDETSISFPSITICNYNQFRKSLALRSPDLMDLLKDLFSLESRVDVKQVRERGAPGTASLLSNNWNITAELIGLAHVLEQMVIMCYWSGVKITCHDYFSRTLTEVGVCYTFNSHKVQKEYGPLRAFCAGSDCGLTLRLNIQTHEHYFGEGDASGIRVLVHDSQDVPLVRQHGFSVGPGTAANAAIKVRQESLAEAPYGSCIDTSRSDFVNPLQYYDVYTHSGCQIEHKVDYISESCGCRMYYDPGDYDVCRTLEEVKCVNRAKDNYTRWAVQELNQFCARPCQAYKYSVRLSTASYPSDYVVDELVQSFNMSENTLRKNIIQLRLYFEDLTTQKVQQTPAYTGSALFADIGGMLGLCIGGSLLTLIEISELILLLSGRLLSRG